MEKNLSIIIVSFNTKGFLEKCLESIFHQGDNKDIEVIVVDNGSQDDSCEMIKNKFPQVKLIENKENLGFGRANNQGAKIALGEYLFLLNPDTLIKENIFPQIIEFFKNNSSVGIITPLFVLENGVGQSWSFGKEKKFWQLIKNKLFKKEDWAKYKVPDSPLEVDYVAGAALAIKVDVFRKINGFDERFFVYYEDEDLCLRVKKEGYKIVVLPKIKVVHFGGKSLISNKIRKKLYYQSQNYFWRKHYGLASSILLRFIRWPYKFYILNFKKGLTP